MSPSSEFYDVNTPAEVASAKGLHLLTQNTPSGQTTQILLEELADKYDNVQWGTTLINIGALEQKKEWFLHLNPNGRIPVLVDNGLAVPFPVFETGAQLVYLHDKIDQSNHFGFVDALEQSEALQWIFFWHGGGAPLQGQIYHFAYGAPEKIPYAIARFKNETLRAFGALEAQLSGVHRGGVPRDYLVGADQGKYSIADIRAWPWVRAWKQTGLTAEDVEPFPLLLQWVDRIAARPAVQRAVGGK